MLLMAVWSNFEIADMDFWRGEAYTNFFEHLDATGGFYYEVCLALCMVHCRIFYPDKRSIMQRWGDAPVHSIGVSILAHKDQIHFFDKIGYEHDVNMHCPQDSAYRDEMSCSCDFSNNFGALSWHLCVYDMASIYIVSQIIQYIPAYLGGIASIDSNSAMKSQLDLLLQLKLARPDHILCICINAWALHFVW